MATAAIWVVMSAGAQAAGLPAQGAAPPAPVLWEPPLGRPLEVSAAYSLVDGPYRAGHRGVDLPANPGSVVRSPATGTISFVGFVVDRPVLSFRVGDSTTVSMEPVTSGIRVGERVTRGEVIGRVGDVGSEEHCRSRCLHVGVRVDGTYVNPLRYFRARPVLLPW